MATSSLRCQITDPLESHRKLFSPKDGWVPLKHVVRVTQSRPQASKRCITNRSL